MAIDRLFVEQTTSTNDELNRLVRIVDLPEGFCLWTGFQTAGRGQQGNTWESAPGENLLASLLLRPVHVPAAEQFLLSQMAGVGVARALSRYAEGVQVKWPNDIYWHDRKLAGILIEHALHGSHIRYTVVGLGLNVNQTVFYGGFMAVSLRQLIGKSLDRSHVLDEVVQEILDVYKREDAARVREEYMRLLWRGKGFHPYEDVAGRFEARIVTVNPDGRLLLEDREGRVRGYYMKEVKAVIVE